MVGVSILAGMVGGGLWLKLPRGMIWTGVILCWLGLVMAHAPHVLQGSAVPGVLGGDLAGWLLLGFVVAVATAYRALLAALRRRARPVQATAVAAGKFTPAELSRYARHIILREIGGPGQRRLKDARVLVVGAGGLGAPVAALSGGKRGWPHRGDR